MERLREPTIQDFCTGVQGSGGSCESMDQNINMT